MATRILACLILLVVLASASPEAPYWEFLPANTIHDGVRQSGLAFTFDRPPADRASIVATVIDCGHERQVVGAIDTDFYTLLRFPIESLDGFRVRTITISSGRVSAKVMAPRAGEHYRFF